RGRARWPGLLHTGRIADGADRDLAGHLPAHGLPAHERAAAVVRSDEGIAHPTGVRRPDRGRDRSVVPPGASPCGRPREARDAGVARVLVITPGMGIGPEVTVKALAARPRDAMLIGSREVLDLARGVGLAITETHEPGPGLRFWEPRTHEPVPVAAIRAAVALCGRGRADAIVTGPIHKAKLA